MFSWSDVIKRRSSEFRASLRGVQKDLGCDGDEMRRLMMHYRRQLFFAATIGIYKNKISGPFYFLYRLAIVKMKKDANIRVTFFERILYGLALISFILSICCIFISPVMLFWHFGWYVFLAQSLFPLLLHFRRRASTTYVEILGLMADGVVYTIMSWALYFIVVCSMLVKVLKVVLPALWFCCSRRIESSEDVLRHLFTVALSNTLFKNTIGLKNLSEFCDYLTSFFTIFDNLLVDFVPAVVDLNERKKIASQMFAFSLKDNFGEFLLCLTENVLNMIVGGLSFALSSPTIVFNVLYDFVSIYIVSSLLSLEVVNPVDGIVDGDDLFNEFSGDELNNDGDDTVIINHSTQTSHSFVDRNNVADSLNVANVVTSANPPDIDTANGVLINGNEINDLLVNRVAGTEIRDTRLEISDTVNEDQSVVSVNSRVSDDPRRISSAPRGEFKNSKRILSKQEMCVCPIPIKPDVTLNDLLESYNNITEKEDFSSYFSLRLEEFVDKPEVDVRPDVSLVEPIDVYLKLNVTLEGLSLHHLDFVARFTPSQYQSIATYDFLSHLSFKHKRSIIIARPAVCIASDPETCQGSILVYYKLLFFVPFKTSFREHLRDSLWRTFVMHFTNTSRSGYGKVVRKCKTGTALTDNFGSGLIDLSAIVTRNVGRMEHNVFVSSSYANLVDDFRVMYPNLNFVINSKIESDVDHPICQVINCIQMKVVKSKLSYDNTDKVVYFSSRGPTADDVKFSFLHNHPILDCYDVDRIKSSIGAFSAKLGDYCILFDLRSYAYISYLVRLDVMHMNRNILSECSELKRFMLSIDEVRKNLKNPDSFSAGGVGVMYHLCYYFSFSDCVVKLKDLGFETLYYTYHEDLLAFVCDDWLCPVTEMRCRKEGSKLHFYTSSSGGKSYICDALTYLSWVTAPDVGRIGDIMYVKEKLSCKGSLTTYKLKLLDGYSAPPMESVRIEYDFMVGNYVDNNTMAKRIKAFKLSSSVFNKFMTAVLPKLSVIKSDEDNFNVFLAVFRGHQYRTLVVGTGSRSLDPMASDDDCGVVRILFRYVISVLRSRKKDFLSKIFNYVNEIVYNESEYSIDGYTINPFVRNLNIMDLVKSLNNPNEIDKVFYIKKGILLDAIKFSSNVPFLFRPNFRGIKLYDDCVADSVYDTIVKFESLFLKFFEKFNNKIFNSVCGDLYIRLGNEPSFLKDLKLLTSHFGGDVWYLLKTQSGPVILNRFRERAVRVNKIDYQQTLDDYALSDVGVLDNLQWMTMADFVTNHTVSAGVVDSVSNDPFIAGVMNVDANDMAAAVQYRKASYLKNKSFIESTIYSSSGVVDKILNVKVCSNLRDILVSPRLVSRGSNAIVQALVNDYCLQLAISIHLIAAKCLNFELNKNFVDDKLYHGIERVAPYCIDTADNRLVRTSFVAISGLNLKNVISRLRTTEDMLVFHPLMQLSGIVRRLETWVTFDPASVLFVQGVAGCGKTTFIRNLYKRAKCNKIVMTATKESAKELADCKAITVTSFLQNYDVKNVDLLIIDEAVMLHEGLLILTISYVNAKRVLLLGDMFQLRFVHGTTLIKPLDMSFFDLPINQINMMHTYRMPQDATALLSQVYGDITTSNKVKHSLSTVLTSNPTSELRKSLVGKSVTSTLITCFTQSTKLTLKTLFCDYRVLTVHEAQGQTFDHVLLVRDSHHSVPLFEPSERGINPWMLVALSRHTVSFKYFTVISDYLFKIINNNVVVDCFEENHQSVVLNKIITALPSSGGKLSIDYITTYFSQFQNIKQKIFSNTRSDFKDFCEQFKSLEKNNNIDKVSVKNMQDVINNDINIFYATSCHDINIVLNQVEKRNPKEFVKRNWINIRNTYQIELSTRVDYENIRNLQAVDVKYDIPRMIICSRNIQAFTPEVDGRDYYGRADCWYVALKTLMDLHYCSYENACESMGIPSVNYIVKFISMLRRFSFDNNYILHSDLAVRERSLFVSTMDISFAKNFKVAIYLLLKDSHIVISDERSANYVLAYNTIDVNKVLQKFTEEITIEVETLESAKQGMLNDTILNVQNNESLANKVLKKICNIFSGSELYLINPYGLYNLDWEHYGVYNIEVSPVRYDVINDIYFSTFHHTYRGSDLYPRYVVDSWFEKEIHAEGVKYNAAELMAADKDKPIEVFPKLSTTYYGHLPNTPKSLLNAISKRNLYVPKMQGVVEAQLFAKNHIKNFIKICCHPNVNLDAFLENPINASDNIKFDWLRTLAGTKLRAIENENKDIFEIVLNDYEMHLKAEAKAMGTDRYDDDIPKGQVIAAIAKQINSHYSPIFRVMLTRLLTILKPNIIFGTRLTINDYNSIVNSKLNGGVDYHFYELDISSYDKSINSSTFSVFESIMILLGVSDDDVRFWRLIHELNTASSRNGIKFLRCYQTISGDSATALSNTIINIVSNCDLIEKSKLSFLFGDDSLFIVDHKLDETFLNTLSESRSREFNLETKLAYHRDYGYFCGYYLVLSIGVWKFLPDLLKRLEKLGNTCYSSDTDFFALSQSAADLYKHYDSYEHNMALSDILNNIYKNDVNYELAMSELFKIYQKPDLFLGFFDHICKPKCV
nr:TPA_asm: hypothetical protein [Stellipti virus 2]